MDSLTPPVECPNCGGEYLHHMQVEVYERAEGERGHSRCTIVTQEGVTTSDTPPPHVSGNPSKYRNGLRIIFDCEHCDAQPRLVMLQHKGQTFSYWEMAARFRPD